jgi:Tol biopolymer transport system component
VKPTERSRLKRVVAMFVIAAIVGTLLSPMENRPAMAAGAYERWLADLSVANLAYGQPEQVETHTVLLADLVRQQHNPLEKISVPQPDTETTGPSNYPSISEDGNLAVFASNSGTLVPNDNNGKSDIFIYDRHAKTMKLISQYFGPANGHSYNPVISPDGRYVLFASEASNLTGDSSGEPANLFLYDQDTESIRTVAEGMIPYGNGSSRSIHAMSADGRYIAFYSSAPNGVADDLNQKGDIFLKDLRMGVTIRLTSDSKQVSAISITPDGGLVTFDSSQENLVDGDSNGQMDVFVYDVVGGLIERVSVNSAGVQGDGYSVSPSISANGRFVSFVSDSGNLSEGEHQPGHEEIYVYDRTTHTTAIRTSALSGGNPQDDRKENPRLSADGRYLIYSGFKNGATPLVRSVYLHDGTAGTTETLSVNPSGDSVEADSSYPFITLNGKYAAFASDAQNLTATPDRDTYHDVFVDDLSAEDGSLPAWPAGSELMAAQTGGSYASLSWPQAVTPGGAGTIYAVYAAKGGVRSLMAVTRQTSYLVTGLVDQTSYMFEVVAGNADRYAFATSAPLTVQVTTKSEQTPPAQPDGVIVKTGQGKLTVTWQDPPDLDLTGIQVYWKKADAKEYMSLPIIRSGKRQAHLTGILNGENYDIQIQAEDAEGNRSEPKTVRQKSADGPRVERISVARDGSQGVSGGDIPFTHTLDVSDDGRYFVFDSDMKGLVPARFDKNPNQGISQIYLYDRKAGTIQALSRDDGGALG